MIQILQSMKEGAKDLLKERPLTDWPRTPGWRLSAASAPHGDEEERRSHGSAGAIGQIEQGRAISSHPIAPELQP
jgi:hypothetical protein